MLSGRAASAGTCGQSCTWEFSGALSKIGLLSRSKTTRVVPPPVVQETIVQPPGETVFGASVKPLITGAGDDGTGVAVGGCGGWAFTFTVTCCCVEPPGPCAVSWYIDWPGVAGQS